MNIIENLYQSLEENKKTNEPRYKTAYEKCEKIYEGLMDTLEEAERKSLIALSNEYSYLNCLSHEQGFKDGFASALKMIFETLLSSYSF